MFQIAPSCSSSVREQRENYGQDPPTRESNRPRRICIQETDLESSKEKYINAVLNHACRGEPIIGAVNEMLALMQKVASEYKGYSSQHTTDLTVRNYAQRSKDPSQTFSLSQWVERNGRNIPRFASLPEDFQRSPIPS
ncbi:S100P-binding protein isoform X2 [Anolis sagrei]|uniref:S100P-binding protein isoform X2 n=1 Tax=Anolis sagrei TaxID=38937 RepID=UPI003520BEA1